MEKIILASASPRRRQLLEWARIPFEVMVHSTDESFDASLPPAEIAMEIARKKAEAVAAEVGTGSTVIAADTIVVCGQKIIGKPTDRADAIATLQLLQNNSHHVVTGVCILKTGKTHLFADETQVAFHPLTSEQIAFYVDTYRPYDKAGAYAIQEWIGVVGIRKIEGDFYNVMGLPVSRVVQALQNL